MVMLLPGKRFRKNRWLASFSMEKLPLVVALARARPVITTLLLFWTVRSMWFPATSRRGRSRRDLSRLDRL